MSAANDRFLESYLDLMGPRLPKIADEYARLPAGYRKLLAVQSGFPELADKRLDEISAEQIKVLIGAWEALEKLQVRGGLALRRASWSKKARG